VPLDPIAAQLLESMAKAMPPIETMTPTEGRAASAALSKLLPTTTPRSTVAEQTLPAAGGEIRVRTYRPQTDGTLPVFMYIHGGGWVIGGEIEMFDPLCDEIACGANCVVVSVGYRLAPEHSFPAPLDDCTRVARWIHDNASLLDIDTSRVAVGGDSSGGNLAAALALSNRDAGGPEFCLQLLVYPPTNHVADAAEYAAGLDVPVLSGQGMAWYWQHYAGDADPDDPYLSPLRAADLEGLPPAYIITAEFDVLRAEVDAYAARLREASVPVVARHFDGMFHGFFGFGSFLPQAGEAVGEAIVALRNAFLSATSSK
jgi:acetyl esterase